MYQLDCIISGHIYSVCYNNANSIIESFCALKYTDLYSHYTECQFHLDYFACMLCR